MTKEQAWIEALRERRATELGACTDNDYALIFDANGKDWRTETLETGEQIKSPSGCPDL